MTDQKLPSLRRDEYQVAMERCWLMLDEEGGVLEPLGDVRVRRHLANVFAASAVRSVDGSLMFVHLSIATSIQEQRLS